jgi:LacI family transcriptional regulator
MKCTINDIARELGLSRNTVSKALSGVSGVAVETQKMILQKAREMDYKKFLMETADPNQHDMEGTILFLTFSSVSYSDFWISVMKGIEEVLHKNNFNLVLGVMSREDFNTLRFPAILKDKIIKGVIAIEICNTQVCEAMLDFHLPVVTIDMPANYKSLLGKMDIITMENKIHIKNLVCRLYKNGCRRFAFAGDITSDNAGRGFQDRHDAMCEALGELSIAPDEQCSITREPNECFMNFSILKRKLEAMPSMPDVFFCGNDWTALHMMNALQGLGYHIPGDVALIGFDNIPDAEKHSPSLTTIHTPKEHLGKTAARILIERIQNPNIPYYFTQLSTTLVLRESTSL